MRPRLAVGVGSELEILFVFIVLYCINGNGKILLLKKN